MVRVRDVARVELGAKSSDRFSTFNGQPSATVGLYLAPGANAVQVGGPRSRHNGRTEDAIS